MVHPQPLSGTSFSCGRSNLEVDVQIHTSLRKYIPTQGNNPGKLKHAAAITTSIPEEK
jgi:hypothetical protein